MTNTCTLASSESPVLRQATAATGFTANRTIDQSNREAISRAVTAAKRGDMDAVRFLYVRYKDNVYGYVLSILREAHDAEDVTQQVFMKLLSSIGKYEPQSVPFTAWILRVARNVAIDHLRQRRSIECHEMPEFSCEGHESGRELRWGLESALEALPQEQRDVVVLRHVVGLTPGEIAARMERTESSVHGLHHRGRRALKRELLRVECAPTAGAA